MEDIDEFAGGAAGGMVLRTWTMAGYDIKFVLPKSLWGLWFPKMTFKDFGFSGGSCFSIIMPPLWGFDCGIIRKRFKKQTKPRLGRASAIRALKNKALSDSALKYSCASLMNYVSPSATKISRSIITCSITTILYHCGLSWLSGTSTYLEASSGETCSARMVRIFEPACRK